MANTNTADTRPKLNMRPAAWAGVAIALAFVVVLGAGSSQVACRSCHAMRPYAEAIDENAHAGIACYSCHLASGAWSWPSFKTVELTVMYPAAARGATSVAGPASAVPEEPCRDCHSDLSLGGILEKAGVRIQHATCEDDAHGCLDCHGGSVHSQTVRWVDLNPMEECVACHLASDAPTECDVCHAGRLPRDRLARGPWQVTHGKGWRTLHGATNIAYCSTCHPDDYCTKCHGLPLPHPASFGNEHGKETQNPEVDCFQCHERDFCTDCHGIEMPHPEDFLPTHSGIADSSEDPVCLRCHIADDCVECHVKHTHPGRTEGRLGREGGS